MRHRVRQVICVRIHTLFSLDGGSARCLVGHKRPVVRRMFSLVQGDVRRRQDNIGPARAVRRGQELGAGWDCIVLEQQLA